MKPYEYGPLWHSRSTFWTMSYRSAYIHGHFNHTLGKEVIRVQLGNGETGAADSLHAAKCLVTRHIGCRAHRGYQPVPQPA